MEIDVLKTKIKENNISGVFLFHGVEEYTKDHYASLIRKKVDSSPLPEFNHVYYSASTESISILEDSVYSLPYMWEQKLIEITEIESVRFTEDVLEDYARIFSEIPDYLTILIVLRSVDQGNDTKVTKSKTSIDSLISLVETHGHVVKFETEKADKLVSWISRHFNANGIKFEQNVPKEMINVCGSDMCVLQSEVIKLIEAYDGTILKVSDVHKYCCTNSAYKYFDLTNALNHRDMVTARKILYSLDLNRETIPLAIGFLAKNYYEMMMVKSSLASGKGHEVVAKDLRIPAWRIGKMISATSGIDMKTLTFAMAQLADADLKIKNYRGNPQKILEMAFYRICTYGRKA